MFYDRFANLCKQKGVSMSRAALDAGISKSLVTKWKSNKVKTPSAEVIEKLCAYFNMSVAELLGEEREKPTAIGDGLSDEDRQIMELSRLLTPEEKRFLLSQLRGLTARKE